MNQLEYLAVGYLSRVMLPWHRRSEREYKREAALSLDPSASPDYDIWSRIDGGYDLDMFMAGYKREL